MTLRQSRRTRAATLFERCAWAVTVATISGPALGQDTRPARPPGESDRGYVSRDEYERRIDELLRQQELMRQEIDALKRSAAAGAPASAPAAPAPATTSPAPAAADGLAQEVRDLRAHVDELQLHRPGADQFVLAGDAAVGFSAPRHGQSSFDASFAPLVLYRPTDRLLFEAAADIGVSTDGDGNASTSFDLTIANASYELTDNLVIGAGLFVVPFGVYHNHFDPPWINKFPDDPLPFGDGGIAPSSEVGFFLRGAVPAGLTKFTYDFYVTNGPRLVTQFVDAAGSLDFDDFTDLNGNKAVGGRIGFLPVPDMELGYSIQVSKPNSPGFHSATATLQAFDFNYRPLVTPLYGLLDLRAEWVLSDVSRETYDPTGSLGFGPTRFGNYRQGGYVQLGYRPTLIGESFWRDVEFVARYDWLTTPLNAPGGDHEKRITIGVDYWLAPNAVLKVAYEFDDKRTGPDQDAFLVQFGIGL